MNVIQFLHKKYFSDNMNHRPIAKHRFCDAANFSPTDEQGSIDDMNLGILVEDVKIEDPEINFNDDYDLTVDPLTMEIDDDDSKSIESGDDEDEVDECENNLGVNMPTFL